MGYSPNIPNVNLKWYDFLAIRWGKGFNSRRKSSREPRPPRDCVALTPIHSFYFTTAVEQSIHTHPVYLPACLVGQEAFYTYKNAYPTKS